MTTTELRLVAPMRVVDVVDASPAALLEPGRVDAGSADQVAARLDVPAASVAQAGGDKGAQPRLSRLCEEYFERYVRCAGPHIAVDVKLVVASMRTSIAADPPSTQEATCKERAGYLSHTFPQCK
jgi:hypothetical protein